MKANIWLYRNMNHKKTSWDFREVCQLLEEYSKQESIEFGIKLQYPFFDEMAENDKKEARLKISNRYQKFNKE
jgi:hypothetical protein